MSVGSIKRSPLWQVRSASEPESLEGFQSCEFKVVGARLGESLDPEVIDKLWADTDDARGPTPPPTQERPGGDEEIPVTTRVTNVVSMVDVGCPINLEDLAIRGRNTQYFPRSQNVVTLSRHGLHKSTAMVAPSGKITFMGGTSEMSAKKSARMHVRHIQALG